MTAGAQYDDENSGGVVTITAGRNDDAGVGGDFIVTAGEAGEHGAGGNVHIKSGTGDVTSGSQSLKSADSTTDSGAISFSSGYSEDIGSGAIYVGTGDATGDDSGSISFTAGETTEGDGCSCTAPSFFAQVRNRALSR